METAMTRKLIATLAATFLTLTITAPAAHAKDITWGKHAKDITWG